MKDFSEHEPSPTLCLLSYYFLYCCRGISFKNIF